VSPASGTGAQTLTVAASTSGLSAGTYTGALTISASGATNSPQQVNVTFNVAAGNTGSTNGYSYGRAITIAHGQVANSDQANFPVLISGTYSYLANVANGGHVQSANGYDIIFTSDAAGQNRLNWEVESYDPTSGTLRAWVQIPSLSHSIDTVIYLFYGNSAITSDQSNATGTWDSNYKGVWHFGNGSTLSLNDSTSNKNNGTNSGAGVVAGEIGGAASFNGSSQYISVPDASSLDLTSAITLSAWVNPSQTISSYAEVLDKSYVSYGAPWHMYALQVNPSAKLRMSLDIGGVETTLAGNTTIAANTWSYVTMTYDGGNMRVYVNGKQDNVAVQPGSFASNTVPLNIGRDNNGTEYFPGVIDEARVSSVARSADWITTEYNNQSSPSTFYALGAEQTYGGH
jgi:hypothetical protein